MIVRSLVLAIIFLTIAAVSADPFDQVLFWVAHPEMMASATHISPQVWVESDVWAKRAYPRYPLTFWVARGVIPLRPLAGMTRKYTSAEEYLREWVPVAQRGYPGVAIDEFGSPTAAVNTAMAEALRILRREFPLLTIAVWHAGALSRELAEAYREAADLVMLETYARSTSAFVRRAQRKLLSARAFGIASKCLLALGINDTRPGAGGGDIWAKDLQTVHNQLDWIRRRAGDTAGVAFFAIYASDTLMVEVDRYIRKCSIEDWSP